MTMQQILADLPEIYRGIFPSFFEEQIPVETLATCSDCAMCAKPDQPKFPGQEFFQPDIKCCAYHPKLPNFLVGGLLLDANPAMDHGRNVIREKLKNRIGVNPHSILPPKKYSVMHKFGGERGFGKNYTLLCPYYIKETGHCGVWKFRDAVCSTYFCKVVAGQEGKRFWNVLRGYLIQSQDALGWYALYRLSWDVEAMWEHLTDYSKDSMDANDLDDKPISEEAYSRIWGRWAGREEEFFKKTFEIVSEMKRDDFDRIAGMNIKVFFEWMKQKHKDVIAPNMPKVLRKNPDLKSIPSGDGLFIVKTEAGIFTIQPALFEVLALFDGVRPTSEIVKLVAEQWNDTLGDELLIPMFQNRMVIPV